MKKIAVLLILFTTLAACSDKMLSLSCNDADVTGLVLEISEEELKNQLFKFFLNFKLGTFARFAKNMSYADYLATEDSKVKTLVVSQTEDTLSAGVNLSAIRLQKKNELTGMITCAAGLSIGEEESSDIDYTAQITDEEELYVEVFGL